jgi:hypothetical protein
MKVSEIYMTYIAESFERPLGKGKNVWWRHEYQDATGNLSHIHSLIWIEHDCLEDTLDQLEARLVKVYNQVK